VTLKSGLTTKQAVRIKKLAKCLAKGQTMTQAALAAGFGNTKNSARNEAYSALQNPCTKKALDKALESAGVGPDAIAKVLSDGLRAKKKDLADHDTRLKCAKLACELRGDLKSYEAPTFNLTTILANIRADSVNRGGWDK